MTEKFLATADNGDPLSITVWRHNGTIDLDIESQRPRRKSPVLGTRPWYWASKSGPNWWVEGISIAPDLPADYVTVRVHTGTQYRRVDFHINSLPDWLRTIIREVK